MKKSFTVFAVSIVCALFIFAITSIFIYLYFPLELKTFDLRTLLRTKKSDSNNIVIVDIDDYSIEKLGRFRNWPRWYYASLIDYLTEEDVKVIGMDMLFPEPDTISHSLIDIYIDNKGEKIKRELEKKDITIESDGIIEAVLQNLSFDKELMLSIKKSRRVILPVAIIKSSDVVEGCVKSARAFSRKFPYNIKSQFPEGSGIAVPTKKLMEGVKDLGAVNTDPDIDGIIRKIPLFYKYHNEIYPSFSFVTFLHAKNLFGKEITVVPGKYVEVGSYIIPVDENVRMLINFRGGPFSFRYISFYDVLKKRIGKGFFKGKTVLLGSSAVALSDLKPIPVSRNLMPGAEIHANGLSTLMNRNFIGYPSNRVTLLLLISLSIITTVLASRLKPWLSLFLTIMVFVAFLVTSDILFDWKNVWLEIVRPTYVLVFSYIVAIGYRYAITERSKRELRRTFDRYVSKEVVEKIISNPLQLKLGGERKHITVLFADIRGFTSMSESMKPEAVVGILNDYLSVMTDIILRNGGTIDKFIGDAIMAVFGAPIPYADHAYRASKTGLEMREALKTLQQKWKNEGRYAFDIGIGINTGEAIVGNIGSIRRTEYTVIGDTVNLGARIEPMNKEYKTHILISEFVYEKVKETMETVYIGKVKIRGKKQEVGLFELVDFKE